MFFQAICRTGIFMICAQAIVHFRPQESYEKYLKLLVSAMVLIQLFLPIANLFAGGSLQDAAAELALFQEDLEQAMEEAQDAAADAAGYLEQMSLEEVRKRVEEKQRSVEGQEAVEGQGTAGEQGTRKEQGTVKGQEAEAGQQDTVGEEASQDGAVTVEVEPVEPVQIQVK